MVELEAERSQTYGRLSKPRNGDLQTDLICAVRPSPVLGCESVSLSKLDCFCCRAKYHPHGLVAQDETRPRRNNQVRTPKYTLYGNLYAVKSNMNNLGWRNAAPLA
jgi:hypothetical protein